MIYWLWCKICIEAKKGFQVFVRYVFEWYLRFLCSLRFNVNIEKLLCHHVKYNKITKREVAVRVTQFFCKQSSDLSMDCCKKKKSKSILCVGDFSWVESRGSLSVNQIFINLELIKLQYFADCFEPTYYTYIQSDIELENSQVD